MTRLIVLIFMLLPSVVIPDASSQDSIYNTNHIFDQKIRTVLIHKVGWNLSYPVINLNSGEKLIFSFDLLDDHPDTYYYTFIHCDKDWNKSDIFPTDYLNGFAENPVEDYENSFNTTVSYIHYNLILPNEKVSFKLSGNYILVIYPADKEGEPSITQRFIVAEDAGKVTVSVHRPDMSKDKNTHQQVDFVVNYSALTLNDPYGNVFACILQNGRWDNAVSNLKPDFSGNNELKYSSLSDKNIFHGGNEFRYFDIKSVKYQTEFIKKIDYAIPNYNVYLYPSDNRGFKPYFYWQDFNGRYYIAYQEGKNPDIEADYVNVYFSLPSDQLIQNGKMYVSGNLNNWAFDKNNLMIYNPVRKEYECTMLLKQGWYNYEYVFMKDGASAGNATLFEGSHYETENDYIVLIYYRNPRDRYDRVIGSATVNTLNKISN